MSLNNSGGDILTVTKLPLDSTLLKAESHGKKGELVDAIRLYQLVLAAFPNNKRAQLGLAALGEPQMQLPAVAPQFQIDYIKDLYNLGETKKVLEMAGALLQIFPGSISLYSLCSSANCDLGKFDEAVKCYKQILKIKPDHAAVYNNMGNILAQQGKFDEAIEAYDNGILVKPANPAAYLNLGNVFQAKEQYKEAIVSYKQALVFEPDNAGAYNGMGVALQEQGQLEEGIEAYHKALSLKPDYAEAHNNMGVTLQAQGMLDAAIECYHKALVFKPDYAGAYNNMGVTLQEQGKLEEAVEVHYKALELTPHCAETYNNIGNALLEQDDAKSAQRCYKMAIEIAPDYAEAHLNMSLELLRDQKFSEGFNLYEWRLKTKKIARSNPKSLKPLWRGEINQTVYLTSEQGLGDVIMFSSIIPELLDICSKLIIQCDERLIPLFEKSFPKSITYHSDRTSVAEDTYDFHISITSLGQHFRKTVDSFSDASRGWLLSDHLQTEQLRSKLVGKELNKVLGISWKTTSSSRKSSVSLYDLVKALHSPTVTLVSLQYGDVDDEIAAIKDQLGIDIIQVEQVENATDICGLASLINACDKVVSIDNITIHLSGALGANSIVLLNSNPDWKWGRVGMKTPIYGFTDLYRQSAPGDWEGVFKALQNN